MSIIPAKSIQKNPNGTFTAFYYVNRRRRQKTFSSKRLAEDFLLKQRLDREKDEIYGKSNDVSIIPLIKEYRREVKKSHNSMKRDDLIEERVVRWLNERSVSKVSHLNKSVFAGYEKWRGDVSYRTIEIDMKFLVAALNHAWRYDKIAFNPLAKYRYKSMPPPFSRFLELEEIQSLLKAAKAIGIHDIIYCSLTCGMRSEELCFLESSDYKGGMIHLRKKTIDLPDGRAEWEPKWGKERWTDLGRDYANDKYLQRIFKQSSGLVFTNKGKMFTRDALHHRVKKACKESGITRYSEINVHTLRHTHITYAVARGINLRTIMGNVGINDFSTLLRYTQAVRNLGRNLPSKKRFPWQI